MLDLKQDAEKIEEQVYEYLQMMLSQLKEIYSSRSAKLKSNYLELMKKDQKISYNENFINEQYNNLREIDFLNNWEVYQKIYMQITTGKMQLKEVEKGSMISQLDFKKPAMKVF